MKEVKITLTEAEIDRLLRALDYYADDLGFDAIEENVYQKLEVAKNAIN